MFLMNTYCGEKNGSAKLMAEPSLFDQVEVGLVSHTFKEPLDRCVQCFRNHVQLRRRNSILRIFILLHLLPLDAQLFTKRSKRHALLKPSCLYSFADVLIYRVWFLLVHFVYSVV